MRISDWSSDVCSSDLRAHLASYRSEEEAIAGWEILLKADPKLYGRFDPRIEWAEIPNRGSYARLTMGEFADRKAAEAACATVRNPRRYCAPLRDRSEEHTSELQSLMRNSYAVFCLKKKKQHNK